MNSSLYFYVLVFANNLSKTSANVHKSTIKKAPSSIVDLRQEPRPVKIFFTRDLFSKKKKCLKSFYEFVTFFCEDEHILTKQMT